MVREVIPALIVFFLYLVVATGCTERDDLSHRGAKSPVSQGGTSGEALPPTIRFSKTSTNQISTGYTHLVFEVRNPNAFPLPYSGYMRHAYEPPLPEGTISPLYTAEFQRKGKWEPHPIGWCGTGVGPVELRAKERVVFDFHAPDDDWESLRIAIDWGKDHRTWSEPVTRARIRR